MSAPHLLEERRGPVLLLTLNRPEVRNAISPEMACRLADAFVAFDADDTLRVAILTGAGEQAFCAGG
ncbi:enoyl-CoA hydratase-related protein [Alloyangia mangrovi]|uniref:enoyl-CoA hydratase-related protein n=1 Tax=Alloyangia mangrovi TaxID=1779329 RepID=UPI0021A4A674|nr:enoyl-CoA hydratase-related protein [Alloyangia mangrovi]